MDINYHLFFALASFDSQCNLKQALWQSTKVYFQTTKLDFQFTKAYIFSKSTHVNFQSTKTYFQSTQVHFQSTRLYFKVQNQTFKVQKQTFKVQKYTFKVQGYTFNVQKRSFKVQSNFRNLGNGISGTRNLQNPSGSRNPVPRTGYVQTSEQNLTRRNPPNTETFETSGTQPSEPGTLAICPRLEPGFPEPVSGNGTRNLGTAETCRFAEPVHGTSSRNPVPSRNRQNTPKSILCKDPIAFCCWGKKKQITYLYKPIFRANLGLAVAPKSKH